jgi:hypothetical protein
LLPNLTSLGLTAIVTGANGISGFHTMRVLLESPERWTKIWAASRRPPPEEMMALLPAEARKRVEHVALDFLSSPDDIAKELEGKGVTADYVFVRFTFLPMMHRHIYIANHARSVPTRKLIATVLLIRTAQAATRAAGVVECSGASRHK